MARYKIAVVPGDGIGKEVMVEGLRALETVGRKFGIGFEYSHYDWSCETYKKTGRMMPEDGIGRLRDHDAVFLGAGVPDHISLWGLLIPIRRQFDQYVNLRPIRLLPGIEPPLRNKKPDDIDFWVVRENVEGEYSQIGGRMFAGTEEEMVVQSGVFTRRGTDRILRYAFEVKMSSVV
jgi:tartrate dehydrogenase/decarboxylase/D-malate dehydrogenase